MPFVYRYVFGQGNQPIPIRLISTFLDPADLPTLRGAQGAGSWEPQPGEQIGPYTVVRMLGEGGFGVVCEAQQLEPVRRRVALKRLDQQLDSPETRQRFLREGRLAAGVSHPNSLYVFGSEEIEGGPVITMEVAGGGASPPLPEVTEAGELDIASERAGKAIELDPDWVRPHLVYTRTMLLSGDDEGAGIAGVGEAIGGADQLRYLRIAVLAGELLRHRQRGVRLTGPRRPHDGDEFLLLDLQVDAVQSDGFDFVCLVDLVKIVQLEHVVPLVRKD